MLIHFKQADSAQSNKFLIHLLEDNMMNQLSNNRLLMKLMLEGILALRLNLLEGIGLQDNFTCNFHFHPNMCIELFDCNNYFILQSSNNLNYKMKGKPSIGSDHLKVHNLFCILNKWFVKYVQLLNMMHYLYFHSI